MGTSPSDSLAKGTKATALAVTVVGFLAAASSLLTVAGTAYTLATGKAMAGDAMRGFTRAMSRGHEASMRTYDEALERAVAAQEEMAPYTFATLVPYAGFTAFAAVLALVLFTRGRASRAWLARLALGACVLRGVFGWVQYRQTTSAAEISLVRGLEDAQPRTPFRGDEQKMRQAKERAERIQRTVGVATRAATILVVLSQTALLAGFWGFAAWMFTRRKMDSVTPDLAGGG